MHGNRFNVKRPDMKIFISTDRLKDCICHSAPSWAVKLLQPLDLTFSQIRSVWISYRREQVAVAAWWMSWFCSYTRAVAAAEASLYQLPRGFKGKIFCLWWILTFLWNEKLFGSTRVTANLNSPCCGNIKPCRVSRCHFSTEEMYKCKIQDCSSFTQ